MAPSPLGNTRESSQKKKKKKTGTGRGQGGGDQGGRQMASLLHTERAESTGEYGNPRGSLKLGCWAHVEGQTYKRLEGWAEARRG